MKKLKKPMLILIAGFAILFVFRMIYGYSTNIEDPMGQTEFFNNISSIKRNYASKEYNVQASNVNQSAVKVDQKYEKIAEINTKSSQFEEEEKQTRKYIEYTNALVQFEQNSGNKGHRRLQLIIGVPPENFDSLYYCLVKIGKVQAKQITKKDKTNEYKELNARKASLEKIRASLLELKTKGGKIEEYMELENRILEIEQQLQELGVNLGDFDDENEFCTVQFSLLEGKEVKIGFAHRIKVSLEWTIKVYFKIIGLLILVCGCSYLILLVIEKLRLLDRISKKE